MAIPRTRAEVDTLRHAILDGWKPGGDMDVAHAAALDLTAWTKAGNHKPYVVPPGRARGTPKPFKVKQPRGRKPGSRVINGRYIPPPVNIDLTKARFELAPLDPVTQKLLHANERAIRDWWRARM